VRTIPLVTTLLDAEAYPADELAALYFQSWEVETGQADSTSSDGWCEATGTGYDQGHRAA
jgi:hypothetical protein